METLAIILTVSLGVALALRIFCFILELQVHYPHVFNSTTRLQRFLSLEHSFYVPVVLWAVCTVVNITNTIISSRDACPIDANAGSLVINPDIAGTGIRLSIYIPQIITLLCLGLGHLHSEPGGIKELGMFQAASLSYMTLNLYKGRAGLEFQDLVTATMFFDATSAAVGMTLSSKQTLSARIFVGTVSLLQLLALVAIVFVMSWIPHFNNPATNCAPRIFWWGVIESGKAPPASFWIYLCMRFVSTLHNAWLSLFFSDFFDKVEKAHDGQRVKVPASKPASSDPLNSMELRNQEDGHNNSSDRIVAKGSYNEISAAAFSSYWEFIPIIGACALGIESFMNRTGPQTTGNIAEWGQSAAVAICAVSIVHVVYTYTSVFTATGARSRKYVREHQGERTNVSTASQDRPLKVTSFHRVLQYLHHRYSLHHIQARPLDCIRRAPTANWYLVPPEKVQEEVQRQNGVLIQALKTHDPKLLETSLEAGASPNAKQADGSLVLFLAVDWGDTFAIGELLDAGADIEARNEEKETTLMKASREGYRSIVEHLLSKRANVNAEGGPYGSALHAASYEGHIDIAELLLYDNADVNTAVTAQGRAIFEDMSPKSGPDHVTALGVASTRGHLDIVVLLLNNGATIGNLADNTLPAASEQGSLILVKLLLDRGVNINTVDGSSRTALINASLMGHFEIVKLLLDENIDINTKDWKGRTALHFAAKLGRLEVVELLLDAGADINLKNKIGKTALHVASNRGYLEVVKLLLDTGADINTMNLNGNTALHLASRVGDFETVRLLLDNGADINITDHQGTTVLHLASGWRHSKIVELLLVRSADINTKDHEGKTALHEASFWGHFETVELLLVKGADINITDHDGKTALHLASHVGRVKFVELLLIRGANINIKDHKGKTALHLASDQGESEAMKLLLEENTNINIGNRKSLVGWQPRDYSETVKLLLDKGADINIADHEGKTALQLASDSGHSEVVELLSQVATAVAPVSGQIDPLSDNPSASSASV